METLFMENGLKPVVETDTAARVIALYLPQFHPIPENDKWWGKGFTEWTNTAKARPLYKGHYQPHVPADLGFYDLRLPEARAAQAEMARAYGIEAFCYYHYWFAGHRLLDRPFNEVLSSGEPDFPFCLFWANETWTGTWHGAPDRILIKQTYPGMDDHRRHFDTLLPAFCDKRYLKVDGKPLFVIYAPMKLPDSSRVIELWRELAVRAGLPGLFLVAQQAALSDEDVSIDGYDAIVKTRVIPYDHKDFLSSARHKIKEALSSSRGRPLVYKYKEMIDFLRIDQAQGIQNIPCVMPNWDNTPRSGKNGVVLEGSTPELFQQMLRQAIDLIRDVPRENRIVFVKSWNESAEGNHLEPDLKFGLRYLEVLREELLRSRD